MYSETSFLLKYIDKHFTVNDGKVYQGEKVRWGHSIIYDLEEILGFEETFIHDVLKDWCEPKGVDWEDFNRPRKLKARWSPELAQDLQAHYVVDAEAELVAMLSEEISKEIDSEVLNGVTNSEELLDRMEGEGYTLTPTIYDPTNFTPFKYFIRA